MKNNILKSSKFDFFCLVKRISFPLIFLGVFLLVSTHAHSAVLYVSPYGSDSNPGDSWDYALVTIQAAIDVAISDDEIWVMEGAYYPISEIDVGNIVHIYGGFPDDVADPQWSDRDWVNNKTIIDGDYSTRCFDISADATIDGLTIRNGNAAVDGGGISIYESNPIITNCAFIDNTAGTSGGGMTIYSNSSPIITNCIFSGNVANGIGSADDGGGAVYIDFYSDPLILNCTLGGNSALNDGTDGGAILHSGSAGTTTRIINSIIWNNTADGGGQQITLVNGARVSITNSDVQGGQAAIYIESGAEVVEYTDNVDEDPKFVSEAAYDFRLQNSSPCKDAGDNTAVPAGVTTDFEGEQRIFNGTVDMGADEYVDTDGDQMADSWEIDHFGDLSRDGTGDFDTDGLTDLEEFQNGTDPNDPDSDGDGVSDGDEVTNVTDPNDDSSFTPQGTGAISGTVKDQNGDAITGVQIDVQVIAGDPCGGWSYVASSVTNSTYGTYSITGLDPGEYYLKINNMNQSNYVNEWWAAPASVFDCNGAESVEVIDGDMLTGVDFQLDLGGSVSGTVLDQITGLPVEETSFGSITLDVGWHKFVYRQVEVTGGQASLAAFKAPGDTEWRWFSTTELDIRVSPDAGADTGITLVNKRNTCQNQHPRNHEEIVQCVDVEATEEAGWYGQSVVSIVNHYQNIHGDDDYYTSYYEGYLYVDTAGSWFFSTDSDDASEIIIDDQLVAGWYGGHGTTGRWDHKYLVTLYRYDNGEYIDSTSGSAFGSYVFKGLPFGTYRVEANAPSYLTEFYQESPDWDNATPVPVTTPGVVENIDFSLEKGLTIQGSVQNVHMPDGSFKTFLEVVIGDDFFGNLPEDIDSITVNAPSGPLPIGKNNFEYFSQWRDFFISLDGSPEIGVYTFTVTTAGATVTTTDYQYVMRTLPVPDASTFLPVPGAILTSKTPSFTWDPVEYLADPGITLFYRFEIYENHGGVPGGDRIFATGHVQDMLYYTLPEGLLTPGVSYLWRVRVADSSDWIEVQNRSNSDWLTFTMPASGDLTHGAIPAMFPNNWLSVTYSTENGSPVLCWLRVIDHDGVASDGSSHEVTVTLPGGGTHPMRFDYSEASNIAAYYFWNDISTQSGQYTFTVTDPDGNVGTLVEDFTSSPLALPDEDTITPSNKNPVDEFITATFDNVFVNGQPYDDFDLYGSIEDLDFSKWQPWYSNVSIGGGAVLMTLSDSVGRAHAGLNFANPETINSMQADIIVNSISDTDGPPRAEIRGVFCHNGVGDVAGKIAVKGNKVYYTVSEEWMNEHDTWTWNTLVIGDLMTGIGPGDTITASISWDELTATLTFDANGNTAVYTVSGTINPPIQRYKILRTRINLLTDTTPTFTWDAVPGANRHRVKIYSVYSGRTVWNGYTGSEPSYTVPPGVLQPDAYYQFRVEAWDAHNPLNVDNVSKTPASNDDNYRFYTGSHVEDDDFPFIDLTTHGVHTANDPVNGPKLSFWIQVHDAQGVPDNIKSVKVIHPDGPVIFLEPYCSNPWVASTPTSCIYRSDTDLPIVQGTYTFIVEDQAGHSFPIAEDFTPDIIGYPTEQSFIPLDGTNIGNTEISFDWEDVPGALFYSIAIYDHDYNLVYQFHTPDSEYHLAQGFLKDNTFYRWRVKTRREYFSDNVDNNSYSPDYWHMLTFTTNALLDTDGDGMPDDWESAHGLNPNSPAGSPDWDGDLDSDGLTNLEEYQNATDPNDTDSEDDGMSDGWENDNGLNPLSNDAALDPENDGWTNLQEFQAGTDPNLGTEYPEVTEFYVGGTDADDRNVGNIQYPLGTLHKAVTRINSLDMATYTIHVVAGTYSVGNGEVDDRLPIEQDVTIEGTGVILDGAGATNWTTGLIVSVGAADVTIQGLTIQNFEKGIGIGTDGACLSLSGVVIEECEIGMDVRENYMLEVDLGNAEIRGCGNGIVVTAGSSNNTIKNGVIHNNSGDGIYLKSCDEDPDENIFEGIQVLDNDGNGIVLDGGFCNQVTDCVITGNNTSETGYGGVALLSGSAKVNQNEITENHCFGLYSNEPVDATFNWWGDAGGPSGVGSGTGDAVSAYVIFEPYATLSPSEDSDFDGLNDNLEQQIIDADSNDSITSIEDVLPGDDFDGDGWSNLAEQQDNTSPVNSNDNPVFTVFYVGGTGANDANMGDSVYPLETLHGAVSRINGLDVANYTIHMAPGMYGIGNEEPDEQLPIEQDVTIEGTGVILDGAGATNWTTGLIVSVGAADVTIQGLTIQNFEKGIGIGTDGACLSLSGVVIEECEIGMDIRENYMLEVDLGNAEISECGKGLVVTAGSSNNTIKNGVIHNNSSDGIYVKSCDEDPDENIFEGIQVLNNAGSGIVLDGGFCNQVTDCVITGNNTSETGYGGVALLSGSAKMNGNDITGNHCFGLYSNEPVDAMNNWWGDESGPSEVGLGSGDAVSIYAIYEPWFGYTEAHEPVEYDDGDDDGLPDWWEEFYFGSTGVVDADGDYDGDGITNLEEYEAGSDPNNPVSVEISNPAANPTYTGGVGGDSITVTGTTENADSITVTKNGDTPDVTGLESWSSVVTLEPGENLIVVTATGSGGSMTATESVTVIRDSEDPSVSIEIPTAETTYLTALDSISVSGVAGDDTQLASVSWTRTAGSDTTSGAATGTGNWATTAISLIEGEDNVVTITATDLFGNESNASITITRETEVTNVEEDLTPEEPPPAVDPLDLDGDDYQNEDETACGSDANDSGSFPPNYGTSQGGPPNQYPTDPADPQFNPQKVKKDGQGNIIGSYLWPDCLNPDDDGDGLPDTWEEQYFQTTTGALPAGDPDNDNITNLDEYKNGTDPTRPQITGFTLAVLDVSTNEDVTASWLPGYNKVLKIEATWPGGGPPSQVWFSLKETSRYPGRAINDPDPAKTITNYESWYEHNGFDFGLTTNQSDHSFAQGPVLVSDSGDGVYTIYLQCWDYGGRTKVFVSDSETDPTYLAEMWVPMGSGAKGIGSAWDYDNDGTTQNQVELDPNADNDMVIFDEGENSQYFNSAERGDDFNNFEEYRGITYTIDGILQHERLNPHRKDLFIRAMGFDEDYPFNYGEALANAGIDVHNTTLWGHDATEDASFFIYYRQGTITAIGGYMGKEVTGEGTSWATKWPLLEWEFKLDSDGEEAWIPVSTWNEPNPDGSQMLNLDRPYIGGTSGGYAIRMSMPHINILTVRLDRERSGAFSFSKGYITFLSTSPPSGGNLLGSRHWTWSTKGLSKKLTADASYGLATILTIPLDHYFNDRPFKKGTIWIGEGSENLWGTPDTSPGSTDMKLAPLSMCEDNKDSGEYIDGYVDINLGILLGNSPNGQWDGDRRLSIDPGCIKNCKDNWSIMEYPSFYACIEDNCYGDWIQDQNSQLNPFDIDNNGYVELPTASDPNAVNFAKQYDDNGNPYTKARVMRHTITHEICHLLAGPWHSEDSTCVMYKYSNNWKRDDHLCDWYRSLFKIHNKVR